MPILTYHHIGQCPPEQADHPGLWVSPESFAAQLDWLAACRYATLSPDELLDGLQRGTLPRRWVLITFDDGWRNNLTHAAPALTERGMQATLFMVSTWLRQGAPTNRWDDTLSCEELLSMRDSGWTIGAHSRTHPKLGRMTGAALDDEIRGSADDLEQALGQRPSHFCYPYGSHSREAMDAVARAGYSTATSTIRDNRVRLNQRYQFPRVMIMNDTTPQRLAYMMSPIYHFVHAYKNRRRWQGLR